MNPERFQQVEQLYYHALEVSVAERAAFLAQACGSDQELRREVESLLAAHAEAGSFIAGNAVEDHVERIASPSNQVSSEEDATAMLPNPLKNPLTESAQRRINQYRIISLLGKGGMGEVWLAEDTRLKRKVALKLLPAEFTNDADRLRRFEQEALAISALNHPNIITIHEISESEDGRFIVMELVAGRTLRAMAAEPISLDSLIAWGSQLAKALHVAHAAGITHRDIKPDNIMVREDGYVKVLDFGLARLDASRENFGEADSMAGTKSGVLLGTVKYMSPEQARGEKVTSATDIFALGILFYELATGTHPFNSATLLGTLQQITTETPRPPAQLNPGLPAAIDALIQRMLAKDASARPSAAQLEAALREIERQRNSGAAGSGALHPPAFLSARRTVGRKPERLELRAAFNSAKSGRGSLLCVAGEPGIGKTTLVEDFLAELAAENQCTIARGRCSERLAGTEAYLPLLEALDILLKAVSVRSPAFRRNTGKAAIPPEGGTSYAEVMRQIAPTWYAQVVPLSGDSEESVRLLAEVKAASQERMKRELANFLQAVAQAQPLVLFFDDLHWADVSTIDLLSFLAGKFNALNVLIIVTYRPSDMLLAKHPFLQIKPDLQARGVCRELSLEFLTEAEIADYLTLVFPHHAFPSDFAKLIHAKTEGSPLFMADLVRYLRDRSVIANASGAWTLAQTLPDIERELPESVRGMIERKIAQLGEDDHKLLTAASVQGYEFDSAVVAQVLNLDADEVEERLEKLERVFAFVKLTSEAEFPNGTLTLRYRFVHVLYQNALYAGLRATRKTTLSRDVALVLEACYGERDASVANELALLWEAARDFARAADSFLQAAGNAAQINAHREAVQLAERGLAALLKLPETPERDGRELDLQLKLGFSLMYVLSWAAPEAGKAIHRSRQLCQQLGDDSRLFAVLNGAASYHIIQAEFGIALELGEQMRQIAEQAQNPALMVVAAVRLAEVYCWRGEDQRLGRQQFERAIGLDRQEYHSTYLLVSNESQGITARRNGCYCLWMLGYNDQALAYAKEGRALAEQLSHPFSLSGAYLGTGVLYYFQRDLQASQKEFEKIFVLAEQYDLGDLLHWAVAINSLNLAFQEPTEAAFARAKQAIASLRAKGVTIAMTWCLAGLGEAYWEAGRSDEGLAIIAEAQTLAEHTGERSYEADIWRIKGELLLQTGADGAQAEAEGYFQKAIAIAQSQSAKIFELRAATSLARLWHRQGKISEARQMLAEIYGWVTEGFDTADLKDAKALLDELRPPTSEAARCSTGSGSDLVPQDVRDTEEPGRYRSLYRAEVSPSIAVLPFVNISNDPDNEYFCDGLAEELLNALSKIEALHVAARTSAFSFKGKNTDIHEIGQKLNVGAVLEGSVRKSGNRLRITAQLVNVADGYHLWSERYDREMQDLFDIQDEISLAIVDALKVKLLGAEKAAITKRYTENTEAYELYLRGRFHYFKWTEQGFKKSIEIFNQVIKQEPNLAPAHAGLSNAYVFLLFYGFTSPAESLPIIKAASARAVEIDANSAESQFALTRLKVLYEWDWSGAERGFKRSLALNPNHAEAHEQYSNLLAVMGRHDEAVAMGQRALELDPLSLNANLNVGFVFWAAGRNDLLREQGEKLIELSPNFFGGHWQIGVEQWTTGKYEQAITALQTSVACGAAPMVSAYLGYLLGLVGRRDDAQKILNQFQELSAQHHSLPFELAIVTVGLGELDRAFELLETAYEQRAGILTWLKYIAAIMPGFRDEPRLAELLRRIGLPE